MCLTLIFLICATSIYCGLKTEIAKRYLWSNVYACVQCGFRAVWGGCSCGCFIVMRSTCCPMGKQELRGVASKNHLEKLCDCRWRLLWWFKLFHCWIHIGLEVISVEKETWCGERNSVASWSTLISLKNVAFPMWTHNENSSVLWVLSVYKKLYCFCTLNVERGASLPLGKMSWKNSILHFLSRGPKLDCECLARVGINATIHVSVTLRRVSRQICEWDMTGLIDLNASRVG